MTSGVVDGEILAADAGVDELGDGEDGVALTDEVLQDAGQGLRGVLGSVVEQDDGPRLDLGGDPLDDLGSGEVFPVQGVPTGSGFKEPKQPP